MDFFVGPWDVTALSSFSVAFVQSVSHSFFDSKHTLRTRVLDSKETELKVTTVKELMVQGGRHSSKQVLGLYYDEGLG